MVSGQGGINTRNSPDTASARDEAAGGWLTQAVNTGTKSYPHGIRMVRDSVCASVETDPI